MLVLTEEQLQNQGVSIDNIENTREIFCCNKLFSKVAQFTLAERQLAMNLCKEQIKSGVFSFIAQTHTNFLVWQEKQLDLNSSKNITELEISIQEKQRLRQLVTQEIFPNYHIHIKQVKTEDNQYSVEIEEEIELFIEDINSQEDSLATSSKLDEDPGNFREFQLGRQLYGISLKNLAKKYTGTIY